MPLPIIYLAFNVMRVSLKFSKPSSSMYLRKINCLFLIMFLFIFSLRLPRYSHVLTRVSIAIVGRQTSLLLQAFSSVKRLSNYYRAVGHTFLTIFFFNFWKTSFIIRISIIFSVVYLLHYANSWISEPGYFDIISMFIFYTLG